MWVRAITTIEEREDDPPKKERSPFDLLRDETKKLLVNQEELAICRKRGHESGASLDKKWTRCTWCGIWLRSVGTIEEREDDPPKKERSPSELLRDKINDEE